MSSAFILTAKQNLYLGPGNVVEKGTSFDINVTRPLVNENNVLLYKDTRESIMRQLSCKGVDLPAARKEYFLDRSHFQVEERKNVLSSCRY